MASRRLSETLVLAGGHVACGHCGHALAAAGTSWKKNAALTAIPVKSLPGAGSAVEAQVVLRRFACPKCGSLLDTETALPDDPFLEDIVRV